jgi:nucleolar MIF4G domain-containing protein 1
MGRLGGTTHMLPCTWLLHARLPAGMWWLPAAGEALIGTLRNTPAAGGTGGAAGVNGSLASIAGGDEEAARLLSLAAAQRMSTDVRRAVFMAVMGSEDAGEAFERLTRLPLKVRQSGGGV